MEQEKHCRVAIIGAGIVGGSIVDALAPFCRITATRRKEERLKGFREAGIDATTDNREAAREADVVLVCVKPGQVVPVLHEIAPEVGGKPVVSFAAAISLDILKKAAPEAHIARAMTNVAVRVRKGYTLYTLSEDYGTGEATTVASILGYLGEIQPVEEQYLDVLTAMSGSGPAYIFTVVESMVYGALREGLPRDLALQAAAHTAIGASHLLLESGEHPAELRDRVVTPGGVTIDGIYELEESRIRTAFMKAISAASSRARVLADQAREQAREEAGM
ncbi:MAG: pyrroline-5-carboxylate reductase [Synergistales bacterium]|nr:pyrroline-5-carboxylate reductase [Synergistales bacterium]